MIIDDSMALRLGEFCEKSLVNGYLRTNDCCVIMVIGGDLMLAMGSLWLSRWVPQDHWSFPVDRFKRWKLEDTLMTSMNNDGKHHCRSFLASWKLFLFFLFTTIVFRGVNEWPWKETGPKNGKNAGFRTGKRNHWLVVVWNMFFSPFSWECHHANWRNYIFQRGGSTTNQIMFDHFDIVLALLFHVHFQ